MNSADVPRIGIKSHLRTEIFPGEGACVISPRRTMVLRGAAAERLLPLLDGTRTLAELVGEVNSELPAAKVGQLLGRLAEAKMIRYRSGAPPEGYAATEAYWDLAGLDGPRVSAELGDGEMAVISVGETDASHVVDLCRASGLAAGQTRAGPGLAAGQTGARPADFSLVLCDDYLDPAIAEINTRHLAEGRSWLLAKTTGADLWVGPVFRPGSGPCWSCLAERLRRS